MGELEGTYRVLQTPGARLGTATPVGVSTLEPGQGPPARAARPAARTHIRVQLLDDSVEVFDIETAEQRGKTHRDAEGSVSGAKDAVGSVTAEQRGKTHRDAEGSVSGAKDAVGSVVTFEVLSLPLERCSSLACAAVSDALIVCYEKRCGDDSALRA
ncbi:hypothetical protein E5288_WYG018448 [Bos mutus]|uniref:Uncharacterized protein n=1 Tax=Bos mutus TaxID=72004 RepID=A0A6B0S7S1_9CETA|nr:hypothetical protein [Bos mutus]